MGGVRFPQLYLTSRLIWKFCEDRKLFVFASYISSKENEIADAESRRQHLDTEWELSETAFAKITSQLGIPDINLFASRLNNKCNRYVSWQRDPGACAINAFTMDWNNCYFYAFPPLAVLLKVLKKIITDKAEGIVVAPFWPIQPWFPLFQSLLCSDPVILEPPNCILLSSVNSAIPPKLSHMAGRLSERRF